MAIGEPLGGLSSLQVHIVVTRADLNLDLLGLRDLYLGFYSLFLLTSLVFKFTIIHDLRNGRDGRWRNLYQIAPSSLRGRECVCELQYTKVGSVSTNHAQLRCAYLVIDPKSVCSHWK